MIIRRYEQDDLEKVLKTLDNLIEEDKVSKWYEGRWTDPEHYVNEYLKKDNYRCFIALDDDKCVGYLIGKIKQLRNKDELMEDEIQKFVITHKIDEAEVRYYYLIKAFFKAYLIDRELQEIMESKEYQRLATNPIFNMKDFKELKQWNGGPEFIVTYIKDYVPINKFLQC